MCGCSFVSLFVCLRGCAFACYCRFGCLFIGVFVYECSLVCVVAYWFVCLAVCLFGCACFRLLVCSFVCVRVLVCLCACVFVGLFVCVLALAAQWREGRRHSGGKAEGKCISYNKQMPVIKGCRQDTGRSWKRGSRS